MMSSWNNATVKAGNLDVKFDNSGKSILVSENNSVLIGVDINELAFEIHDKKNIQMGEFKSSEKLEDMTFIRENDNIRLKIIFTGINGKIDISTGEAVVENADYILLIDIK